MAKKKWITASGEEVPANFVPKLDKLKDRHAEKIKKISLDLNRRLRELKRYVEDISAELYEELLKQNKIKSKIKKGNFTWFNFDRSVKIEIQINENIVFDDMLISVVREKLMSFLDEEITSEDTFIRELVKDAFQTRNGKLDTKRILGLLRYRTKIKNPLYREAMDKLEESYERIYSKTYSRIWIKNIKGEYEAVELNYSAIRTSDKVKK